MKHNPYRKNNRKSKIVSEQLLEDVNSILNDLEEERDAGSLRVLKCLADCEEILYYIIEKEDKFSALEDELHSLSEEDDDRITKMLDEEYQNGYDRGCVDTKMEFEIKMEEFEYKLKKEFKQEIETLYRLNKMKQNFSIVRSEK